VLSVGPTHRYLIDTEGRPTFLNGDTVWSIVVSVLPADFDAYFADRASRGFNAVIVCAIEALFGPDVPRTVDGLEPFLTTSDLRTPNPQYWERVDAVLDAAAAHSIYVLLAPLYLGFVRPSYPGFGESEQGWHLAVAARTEDECRDYGRFLGERYGSRDNLIWVIGGDRNPDGLRSRMRAFVAGILDADRRHLMTAHVHPEASPVEEYEGDDWLTLNQTYTYGIVHKRLLEDYDRRPVRPFILFESTYEGEHDSTPLQIRRQAWWALLCGATGQFLGSFPTWMMPSSRPDALDTRGAREIGHLGAFVRSLPWWKLVPDTERRFLVTGLGEANGLDRATAAVASDRSLAVVYLPTARTISVDLDVLAGWSVRVRWFDPVTGRWSEATTRSRRGQALFTSPGDQDWVLVVDDPVSGTPDPHGTPA
jgi:hypothetical protein